MSQFFTDAIHSKNTRKVSLDFANYATKTKNQ